MITGDGIGPELSDSVAVLLDAVTAQTGVRLDVERLPAGDAALRDTGAALPDETFRRVASSDACLKAPVGESAADVIVAMRRRLDLYANIRPARSYPRRAAGAGGAGGRRDGATGPQTGVDLVIVRENTEDLYTGVEFELGGGGGGDAAVALRIVSQRASERIARRAFEVARARARRRAEGGAEVAGSGSSGGSGGSSSGSSSRVQNPTVTCVHKSNVMRVTDGLFARTCAGVAREYPDVKLEQMYVDACAMNLVRRPWEFDVIVTTNMFGDILSDEASEVAGGLGMAASANLGDDFAIFEPVHGAAFDIAGRGVANPASFMLSAAMMLGWLGDRHGDAPCTRAAASIEGAVASAVGDGLSTSDIAGGRTRTTSEFTQDVVSRLGPR